MAGNRRQSRGWVIILLLCSFHVQAAATRMSVTNTVRAAIQEHSDLRKDFEDAPQKLKNTPCSDLSAKFSTALLKIDSVFSKACTDTACQLGTAQSKVLAKFTVHASVMLSAAEEKKCLSTLVSPEDQEILTKLHEYQGPLAATYTGTDAGDRLRAAFAVLADWQDDVVAMKEALVNTDHLYPDTIETDCPAPCQRCSKHHNSFFKSKEKFMFKCILKNGDQPPQHHALACAPPTARSSNSKESKTWCTVEDWKTADKQRKELQAGVVCGAKQVNQVLATGAEADEQEYLTCTELEAGRAVDALAADSYEAWQGKDDGKVPNEAKLAVSALFMGVAVETLQQLEKTKQEAAPLQRNSSAFVEAGSYQSDQEEHPSQDAMEIAKGVALLEAKSRYVVVSCEDDREESPLFVKLLLAVLLFPFIVVGFTVLMLTVPPLGILVIVLIVMSSGNCKAAARVSNGELICVPPMDNGDGHTFNCPSGQGALYMSCRDGIVRSVGNCGVPPQQPPQARNYYPGGPAGAQNYYPRGSPGAGNYHPSGPPGVIQQAPTPQFVAQPVPHQQQPQTPTVQNVAPSPVPEPREAEQPAEEIEPSSPTQGPTAQPAM
mmetsp:Transcript_20388/g.43855  ORF Transcript_20388/g.43855 Transcript_20388/m.43855 type:complete len:604 (-) Transcript_20388:90-1901(-)